jgi:cytochrome P450
MTTDTAACPAHPSAFRFLDPAVSASPWDYYRALHAHAPVWRDGETGFFIVSTHALVNEVLRDTDRFSAQVDRPNLRPGGLPEEVKAVFAARPLKPTLVGNDPPSHGRFRPLVNFVFSAEKVDAMAPAIEARVAELIDAFAVTGRCDAIAEIGAALPLAVIATELGVPRARVGDLKRWSDAIVQLLGLVGDDARLIECAHAQKECLDYLLAQADARRGAPDGTILSDLVNGTAADGAALEDSELASILVQLLVAGNETTTNTFGSGMIALASDPALQERVRAADAKGMRVFVEEVLRTEAAVQGHYRKAKQDLSLGGVDIPAGSVVHLRYGAANRDAAQFPDPGRIDLERRNAMTHFAFGGGIHFCVGAALARKELQLAFAGMLARLSDICIDPAAGPLERFPSVQHRGVKRLPLVFTAR